MANPLIRLRQRLAELYPDIDSTILILADAGINASRIKVEQTPGSRWYTIVLEASRADRIPALIEVALADYPESKDLQELRVLLLPVSLEMPYDLARVIPPTDTGKPLDRIVGGRLTQAFPDCCAVGDTAGWFCTGTLIAPNLVVTAKHCAQAQISRVFLHGFDTSDLESGEVAAVERRILHPAADVMLLTLGRDAQTTPRRVATTAEVDALTPMVVTLCGFGTVDFEGEIGYGIKRRVETPITSLLCGGAEDAQEFGCQQGMEMVAGHRGLNRDSCHGDSGGPLYIQGGDGEYLLLGVTSRGAGGGTRPCGDGGIYTRLDMFSEWIQEAQNG